MEEATPVVTSEPEQSQDRAENHVKIADDGTIFLSPEAEAAMEGEETPEPERTPEPEIPAKPKEEEAAPSKRKIRWKDREVEVDPSMEQDLIERGYNATQVLQQAQAERDSLAPYSGLVQAIKTSPAIAKQIAEILQGGKREAETPTQFDDPIEQLKYEIRQEVLKEVEEKHVKPMQAREVQTTHQQVIERTKTQVAADPLNKEVHTAIMQDCFDHGLHPESLDSQGRVIRPDLSDPIAISMYLQLDQDPQAYLRTYNRQRTKIAAAKPPPETPDPEKKPATEKPVATKRETRAPFLESAASGGTDASAEAKNRDLIKDLTKKSRAGDFAATGRLLELMA